MKTRELAVYLLLAMVGAATMFGFVPPLLNAKSSFLNAVGIFLAVAIVFGAILTGHSTFTRNRNKE